MLFRSEMTKKSSKAALSLLIVLVAFLGFNSITGAELTSVVTKIDTQSSVTSSMSSLSSDSKSPSSESNPNSKIESSGNSINSKVSRAVFAGTDKNGVPAGFSVADASGNIGSISVTSQQVAQLPDGFSLSSNAMTSSPNALNVLLAQNVTFNASGITFSATPSVTINGVWFVLNVADIQTLTTRLQDGSYLVSVDLEVESTMDSLVTIEAKTGLNVASIPNKIQSTVIIDAGKSRILAQAIFVNAKGVK